MVTDPNDLGPIVSTAALPRRERRRLLVHTATRLLAVTGLVVAAYLAAPVGQDADALGIGVLVIGAVGFVAVLALQVRRIVDSPAPQLRAAEALATTTVLVIVTFAFVYVCMSVVDTGNFSEPITKVNGLYFTVTVLTTVGFGDITAVTESARLTVTVQMLINLLIVGIVVKVLVGASRIGLERRRREAQTSTPETSSSEPSGPTPG